MNNINRLTLGTRGSKLAVAQSTWVAQQISSITGVNVDLQIIETKGDKIIDKPLAEIGGKGLFTLELENALRNGLIDFAVHSHKDLPTEDASGLSIVCVPIREDHRDAIVGGTLRNDLIVGTGSARRQDQIRQLCRVNCQGIRGNIDTRIRKMVDGKYDRVVLAMAGLNRLNLKRDDIIPLSIEECVPAPAQGALALQASTERLEVIKILRAIHHPETAVAISAEREFMSALGGGCHASLGAFAEKENDVWTMTVFYQASIKYCGSLKGDSLDKLVSELITTVQSKIEAGR